MTHWSLKSRINDIIDDLQAEIREHASPADDSPIQLFITDDGRVTIHADSHTVLLKHLPQVAQELRSI